MTGPPARQRMRRRPLPCLPAGARRLTGAPALDADPQIELIRAALADAERDTRGDVLLEIAQPLATQLLDMADAAAKRDHEDAGSRALVRAVRASGRR